MPLLRIRLATFVMLLATTTPALAQRADLSLAVLPFGALPSARAGARAAPALVEEVVAIVSQSGLYTVIDRSADRAIEQELAKAEGFRNFDSRVQLTTTKRLNAKVLLVGVIEDANTEMRPPPRGSRDRPTYDATLSVRVKLVNTETGELIKSASFALRNETSVTSAVKNSGVGKLLPKALQDAVTKQIEDRVTQEASRQSVNLKAHTPDEAIRTAVATLKKPLGEFLQASYGAVVAATK